MGEIFPELQAGWAREQDHIKEQVIKQFKDPPTKNHQLSSYCGDVQDGYNSDYTTHTNNIDGTLVFAANTGFDANASVSSNGEIKDTTSELTVNTAALKIILRKQPSKHTIPRLS